MDHREIIEKMLTAVDAAGKTIVWRVEERQALEKLRDLDPILDWIQQRELSKMGKYIGQSVLRVFPDLLPQNDPSYRGFSVISVAFTPSNLITSYAKEPPTKFLPEGEVENSKRIFGRAVQQALELQPLAEHFDAMKGRSIRAGRLPKQENERQKQDKILKSLDELLSGELVKLRDKWNGVIYDHTLRALEATKDEAGQFLDGINWQKPNLARNPTPKDVERFDGARAVLDRFAKQGVIKAFPYTDGKGFSLTSDEKLREMAKKIADNESQAFFYKMVMNLGGFVTDVGKTLRSVKDTGAGKATPFESSMEITFSDGSHFTLKNAIVASRSVLNTAFFRYQTTFHDAVDGTGQRVKNPDERTVKAAFSEDVAHRKPKR